MPRSTPPLPHCPLCGAIEGERVAVTPVHLGLDRGERFDWVRCSECLLVRLADPPGEDEMNQYYGSTYLPHIKPGAWGRWASLIRFSEDARDRARVRLAIQATHRRQDADSARAMALDIGCGRPTFLRALQKRHRWHGKGLDTTDAGWVGDEAGVWRGLDLRVGDLESASFPRATFDLVTLWHVLEHLPDPRSVLSQLLDLTRPGGTIIVEVPDFDSIPRRLQENSWIGFDSPRHLTAFGPGTLRRVLEETGWEIEKIRQQGTMDPWVLWWLGAQVEKGRTLEGDLENEVLPFIVGKLLTWPIAALQRWLPLGAMTAVARRPL